MEKMMYNPFVIQAIQDGIVGNIFKTKATTGITITKNIDNLLKLLSCKSGTLEFLIYIGGIMRIKEKSVEFTILKSQQFLKLSRKTVYNSINELIRIGAIAKQERKNRYWVNPEFITITYIPAEGLMATDESHVLTPEEVLEIDGSRSNSDVYYPEEARYNYLSDDSFYWD